MPERFEIFDERFKTLLLPDSRLEKLASGCVWSEGPAYLSDDSLIWSDIPGNRLMRWSARDGVSEFLNPAHFQNGHTLDLTGRLLACSHGERAVVRLEPDGTWRVLVDSYQGKRLNSPNDIVVKSDGTIWFTDPDYGLIQPHEGYGGTREQAGCFVYRFDPSTLEISAVITDMEKPNGLAFSPDERTLYVSDTSKSHDPKGKHHIRAYDLLEGKRCMNGRVFTVIEPGFPDGFRIDHQGWLFTSSADSVQIFSPDGELLGKILIPEVIGNLTFGGPNNDRLFIVASSSVYAISLNTRGINHHQPRELHSLQSGYESLPNDTSPV
jgi:gluconolactonase